MLFRSRVNLADHDNALNEKKRTELLYAGIGQIGRNVQSNLNAGEQDRRNVESQLYSDKVANLDSNYQGIINKFKSSQANYTIERRRKKRELERNGDSKSLEGYDTETNQQLEDYKTQMGKFTTDYTKAKEDLGIHDNITAINRGRRSGTKDKDK